MKRLLLHGLLPLLVVGGGVAGAAAMIEGRDTTSSAPPEAATPTVRVVTVAPFTGVSTVIGNGVVEPEREVTISPEVNGKINKLSKNLVLGGRVTQGELLIRIDGRRYKLAASQQRSQVERAKLDLEIERGAADAARKEWEVTGQEPPPAARRIALREPQVEAAKANITAAKTQLETLKLDLSKTSIRAPFNATVTQESVEIGEVVAPGATIATLVGTDRFLVRVSVPVEQLALLSIPRGDVAGSSATLRQTLSRGKTVERSGHVLRLVSELDAESRTAQVLVAVERPLDPPPGKLPLFSRAFVTVEIEGDPIADALSVPREAVFEGNRVWAVDADDRLTRRTLTVAFGTQDAVVATDGVRAGDRVVMGELVNPTEGMEVRVLSEPEAGDA